MGSEPRVGAGRCGDTNAGGLITQSNPVAPSVVRAKHIRVSSTGDWQVLKGDYSGILIQASDNGQFAVFNTNALKPGGGAWGDTSDRRLKTDIQTLTTCLDTIDALNPVQYTWVQGYRNAAPQVGFVADEVEQVIPSAICEYTPNSQSEDGQAIIDILGEDTPIKTIGWKNDMFAYLVGAIKELKAEVDALKAQVNK